jgi:hypothetical protein
MRGKILQMTVVLSNNRVRKPMALEIKAEIMQSSDCEIRNCDIYRKFYLSASTVPIVFRDNSGIFEVVKKVARLLSTMVRNVMDLLLNLNTLSASG